MKALTLWQPWASLVAIGAKPYEFRKWKARASAVGQRIAIHAGAREVVPKEVRNLIRRLKSNSLLSPCLVPALALPLLEALEAGPQYPLPLGEFVCLATIGTPRPGDECARDFGGAVAQPFGNDSDRSEHFNWGWPMLDVTQVEPGQQCRGMQGLWQVPFFIREIEKATA